MFKKHRKRLKLPPDMRPPLVKVRYYNKAEEKADKTFI